MNPVLDLSLRHFTIASGDLLLIGTWVKVDGRQRPAMAICPVDDQRYERSAPCIVTADKAWIWDETIGDPQTAARTAYGFLESLRLEVNQRNIFRLFTLIHDHLDDLLHIPPHATRRTEVVADVVVTDKRSGKAREDTIYDV